MPGDGEGPTFMEARVFLIISQSLTAILAARPGMS